MRSLATPDRPTLTALLGPTNTGKTHRAVTRMLEHETGMIGLPLRLLAREVYDRVTAELGESRVALVTGEEKRIPAHPRYWICTVEAMPVERRVDFVAIDEVQLAAHPERGHVFTERLFGARGLRETWFLGAETIRPLLEQLLPGVRVRRHPRLSTLRAELSHSLGALPPRSAVVAFSMDRVYQIAERLRRRRGGAAVVLGALSPRARNAQVALYQSREVDYLVATDAIGMGLNLDVDHVAFADLRKFDGREARDLEPAELAQIAGRAGRHLKNGTFGTLAPLAPLSERLRRSLERHRFRPLERLIWRNSELAFESLDALIATLSRPASAPWFALVERADDAQALQLLARRDDVRRRATTPDSVRLLWEVCQIPDYRQLLPDYHASLLGEVFVQLTSPAECIDSDWLAARIERLDNTEGDIDALLGRMAFVRTWTYASYHGRWVHDARYWQERATAIEDRLSDALHERLITRFVQRSRSVAAARSPDLEPNNDPEGPFAGLAELKRTLYPEATSQNADAWIEQLVAAPHERLHVDQSGRILHDRTEVARLTRGTDLLRPDVSLLLHDRMGAGSRSRVRRRLLAFARDLVDETLAPLRQSQASELSPAARGLVYQLEQGLGTVETRVAREQLAHLVPADRRLLSVLDVRIGRRSVFVASALEPTSVVNRMALCSVYLGKKVGPSSADAISVAAQIDLPRSAYNAIGFVVFGRRAIRADLAERVDGLLFNASRKGAFTPPAELRSWLGCPQDQVGQIVRAFGYRPVGNGRFERRSRRRTRRRRCADRGAARQRAQGSDSGRAQ